MTIFIDTNIPTYAWGTEHPLKIPSLEVLDFAARYHYGFITDAEVFQELLHRYHAIRRWNAAQRWFYNFAQLMANRTEPVYLEDTMLAGKIVVDHARLSARDAIHAAVMQRLGVTRIVTADGGFQGLPGIERLDPARIDEWRGSIG